MCVCILSQVLKGHSTAILHIVVNHRDGQVLSFSKNMVREGGVEGGREGGREGGVEVGVRYMGDGG